MEKFNNSCENIIMQRKSIRSFSKKEIKNSDILDILNCARLAPSSKNYQPWRYYILSNEEKDDVANKLILKLRENNSENTGYETAKIIKNANKLIIAFIDKNILNLKDTGLITLTLSMGASIQNALLRATELGIGSLWIYDINAISDYLEQKFFPDGMFISGICLGEENKIYPKAQKKELKDIIINKNI